MEMSEDHETTSTVRLSTLEKAVATILSTFIIAILSWIAWTTSETSKAISVVQTRIEYIGGDAKKALELREGTQSTLQDHEGRLLRLEMMEGLSTPRPIGMRNSENVE